MARSRAVSGERTRGFVAWVNSPRVGGVLLVAVVLGCAAGAFHTYLENVALRDRGVVVTGEVVEVHQTSSRYEDSYVVVRFEDRSGVERRVSVSNYLWSPTPKIGDTPTVVYDPRNPKGDIADTRMGPDWFATWACVVGGLVAAALFWPTWTGRLDWNR